MGQVHKILATTKLPPRDVHNGRMFVDLAENIHFHYREHRIIFSAEEFLEFAKAITEGAEGLKKELAKGYDETKGGCNTIIVGGKQKENLPFPNPKESAYFNDRLQVEQQKEIMIDEIHIHYRDYRLAIDNRETFNIFCDTMEKARKAFNETKDEPR